MALALLPPGPTAVLDGGSLVIDLLGFLVGIETK
jgi:hypothetical protein